MSTKFTPIDTFADETQERDWARSLAMLDWDNTRIVFTKRHLVEFLKYTGVTIDPNWKTVAQLPRYAEFGHFEGRTEDDEEEPPASPNEATGGSKPSRGVRTAPGGPSSVKQILAEVEAPDDALSLAPPRPEEAAAAPVDQGARSSVIPKPSRRVRHVPGGPSSLGNMFGNDEEEQEFKPTRKVRSRPGGEDHINNFFS